jgi:cystathionine gamma-synthase
VTLDPRTLAVVAGRPTREGGPLNEPIVLASNLRGVAGDYSRTQGTATWDAFETAVAALEGGAHAVSFASGMGAAAALLHALAPKVLVLPETSYLGVRSLVSDLVGRAAVEVRLVDGTDTAAVVAAARDADVVWLETPSNPELGISDIATVSASVRCPVVVDSTFATPVVQQPLALGAVAVLHSATKFIGGHSDLLSGVVVTDDGALAERLRHARVVQGATPGALETFLALRGLRTLPLRVASAQASAAELAGRLAAHPAVERVLYPGLPGHPGHDVARRQMCGGFGAMVSFVMAGGAAPADRVCDRVRLAVAATSLGGVETTVERRQKFAGDAHVAPGLLRMSVGIEAVEDLWADLHAAIGG